MAGKRPVDLETQLKDIRRQLADQLGSLEFRMESKLSLLSEFQEFFKKRGEVEYEYARSLEKLCERFEKSTKQRNIRTEVRSTFNLWSTLLAETRKMSRERACMAEVMASEMLARLEIMAKDVHVLSKKCKEICIETQDQFLKELRDFGEQTKVYQHSVHNTTEAHNKLTKGKEKLDATRGTTRRKKAQEKQMERQRQFKAQKHLLLKNRNELLVGISKCNSLSMQYFNMDVLDIIEYMDYDYHSSFQRLVLAYKEAEREMGEAVMHSVDLLVENTKSLSFENDLHYFLQDYPQPFTPPNPFHFVPFDPDDVMEYKVNTQDVFKRAQKAVNDLHEEIQTLEIQREEDVKTIQHMQQVNLRKYQVTTVDDALAVLEENGDPMPFENSSSGGRGTASLERGLSLTTKGGQAIQMSQKGKKDTLFFTLGVLQRRVQRAERLALANSELDILEKALDEQKVPPVPVGVDAYGNSIPGEVPRLFGGDVLEYIMATGTDIPLIVQSCTKAIEREGMKMEGLFRVPGPAAYTDELRKGFEEGRDPLAYVQRKIDVAAVASVMKAYFRELTVPLFPTDKYRAFIECTRREDIHSRLDAIRDTVNQLHPAVVVVMRFLFRFLHSVTLQAVDNKMGSANLALVFGPTLTRAPASMDPRQLHNDVPSINVLVQLCIDYHDYIFGDEDEEEDVVREGSISPPQHTESPLLEKLEDAVLQEPDTTPPPPVHAPPPPVSAPQVVISSDDELLDDPAAAPLVEPSSEEVTVEATQTESQPQFPAPSQPPPSSSQPPSSPSQPKAFSSQPEPTSQPTPPSQPAPPSQPVPPSQPLAPSQPQPSPSPPPEEEPSADTSKDNLAPSDQQGMVRQTSGASLTLELSTLDSTLKDIQESLEGMDDEESEGGVGRKEGKEEHVLSDETDDDSESEEEDLMKIDARALYDYTARSDKELTFSKGDMLHVVSKTPDHNWWDGFHQKKRGFIPVAYVEILQLESMNVPQPPERKSSIQLVDEPDEKMHIPKISEPPIEATIVEELEAERKVEREPSQTPEQEEEAEGDKGKKIEGDTGKKVEEDEGKKVEGETKQEVKIDDKLPESSEVLSPKRTPVRGSVKTLTQQFQHEPQPQQRVLVEPHSTHHRRQNSDMTAARKTDQPELPRSSSGGSKVSMLSSAFETKAAESRIGPPPPLKPKPHLHSPATADPSPPSAFPLLSHSAIPSASPLQRAAMVGQMGQSPPPSAAVKKPPPPGKPKSSFKVKRERSTKRDEKPPVKPMKPPPLQGFVPPPRSGNPQAKTQALHEELQAAAAARRKASENLK